MQHRLPLAAALAAIALLGACNKEPNQVRTEKTVDPTAEAAAKAPPVELPPALKASTTYRCKDNSVVGVDFFADDLTARITPQGATPVDLKASAAGSAFTGGGYSVSGSGKTINVTAPGKGSQSCRG